MEGIPWGSAGGDGLRDRAWARLDRFSVGDRRHTERFRQGNSAMGQAFLERVLWQRSGGHVGEAHTGVAEGPREIAAATQEGVRRL